MHTVQLYISIVICTALHVSASDSIFREIQNQGACINTILLRFCTRM